MSSHPAVKKTTKKPPRHVHLLPIISLLPMLFILLAASQFDIYLDPLLIAMAAIGYIALNIIYRALHESLEVGYVVEYSLVALLAYFIMTSYA